MNQARFILLEIDAAAIAWARAHYPQFWQEHLGNKKRTSYLLSRALLLHTLKTYYGISVLPEMIYNQHQKPFFKDLPISFNLTHSDTFIGLLIAPGNISLGIDIESIKTRRNFSGLLKRTFKPAEIQWILRQETLPQQGDDLLSLHPCAMIRFFLLWSAKEAYLKADGRGLQGLDSLDLYPQEQVVCGELSEGSLRIATLAHHLNPDHSSLALYLPNRFFNLFTIASLTIKNVDHFFYSNLSISWSLSLQDKMINQQD